MGEGDKMHYSDLLWYRLEKTSRLLINIFLAFVFIILSFSFRNPVLPKTVVYGIFRETAKKNIEFKTRDWLEIKGENFKVRYTKEDQKVAEMVLNTAEEDIKSVNKKFNYILKEKVPIIIYPNRSMLCKSFGWDADESAMGVYWAGVIRILSPQVWIKDKDKLEMEQYFKKNGPMVHEYAHLVVDYKTRGNYSRWFTEGIAQLVEKDITGFQFSPLDTKNNLYPIKEMNRGFDSLPDQSLAYAQSLAMLEYFVEEYGWDTLQQVINRLGEGRTVSGAFKTELGINLDEFETSFIESL